MRRQVVIGWLLISLVSGAGQVSAQEAVIEVGVNLFQNTISAVNAVLHTASWVMELAGLPSFILSSGEFAESLAELTVLVREGQAIGMDARSLKAQLQFFSLDTAPDTSLAYAARMGEVREQVMLSYTYAMRTQTLIGTTLRTITHIMTLLDHLMAAEGGKQASQTIAQYTAQLVQAQNELKLQTAAYDHAESVEHLSGPLTEQSMININEKLWADWENGDVGL